MSYQRILLKLSGEALQGQAGGIDRDVLSALVSDLRAVVEQGVQVGIVVGGGNIFRGMNAAASHMRRSTADSMGMLATMINALALQDALSGGGLEATVYSAVSMPRVCAEFTPRTAIDALESGHVVILGGGTGNPYFTTDTAACLRALEIEAEVVMKATKVDGVYDKDPAKHSDATRFERLTLEECLARNLKVMDTTAIAMCVENRLPILVFNMLTRGNIYDAVRGKPIGTIVTPADSSPTR